MVAQDSPSKTKTTKSTTSEPRPPALIILSTVLVGVCAVFIIQMFMFLPSIPTAIGFMESYLSQSSKDDYIRELQHFLRGDTFPIRIHPEEYEVINHPGAKLLGKELDMAVPPFWDPPAYQEMGGVRNFLGEYGDRLMAKEEALSVGSTIVLGSDDVDDDNEDFPLELETIYVSIASYRDDECPNTINSIFSRAKFPQRIRVAVVDQIAEGDDKCSDPRVPCEEDPNHALCLYPDQIDFFEMDAALAVGPVFARHIGHRMYRGEYFAIQSDAHVSFTEAWDVDLIEQWWAAKNEMAVITVYLSDLNKYDPKTGKSLIKSRPIMCDSIYEDEGVERHLRHDQQPERRQKEDELLIPQKERGHGVPTTIHEPVLEPFWAAGFSFSRGHFVVNVPYDQHLPMIFQGEEISMGLRGFTYGYDYYTVMRSVCFHMYAEGKNKLKRKKVHKFWEHQDYDNTEDNAMLRLNGIIGMNPNEDPSLWDHTDEKKYGIGNVRTLQKFFDTFGIHTKEQTTERHLCRFVGRPMQKIFRPALRSDGMGLDYDQIDYKFVDPAPDEYSREDDDDEE